MTAGETFFPTKSWCNFRITIYSYLPLHEYLFYKNLGCQHWLVQWPRICVVEQIGTSKVKAHLMTFYFYFPWIFGGYYFDIFSIHRKFFLFIFWNNTSNFVPSFSALRSSIPWFVIIFFTFQSFQRTSNTSQFKMASILQGVSTKKWQHYFVPK